MVPVFTVDYVKLKWLKLRCACYVLLHTPQLDPKHGYLGLDLP